MINKHCYFVVLFYFIFQALAVAAVEGRGHAPGASRKGAPKGVRSFYETQNIYKNSVSSAEAWIVMEGQIMCIEKCTFWMS